MILVVFDYDRMCGPFWSHLGGEITKDPAILFQDPNSIELVCFTGGEDVSPSLYGHKNLESGCSRARDEQEVLIFEQAKKCEIPMTGICRGSQFLNVMCGGTMIQHLKVNHGGDRHQCETIDGKKFQVTSSHHQMSVPSSEGAVVAYADIRINQKNCIYDGELPESVLEEDDHGVKTVRITEAIYYEEHRVFGCQFHAEWMDIMSESAQWQLQKTAELCWGQEHRQRTLAEVEELL